MFSKAKSLTQKLSDTEIKTVIFFYQSQMRELKKKKEKKTF